MGGGWEAVGVGGKPEVGYTVQLAALSVVLAS